MTVSQSMQDNLPLIMQQLQTLMRLQLHFANKKHKTWFFLLWCKALSNEI